MTHTPHSVLAYRWGSTNDHTYLVGSYPDLESARRAAAAEQEHRGGKYGVAVWVGDRAADDPDTLQMVAYFPSLAGEDEPTSSRHIDAMQHLGGLVLYRHKRDSYRDIEQLARNYAECLGIERDNFDFPPDDDEEETP